MKVLRRIKARIRKWRSDRFLKKHYCHSYAQYNRIYDDGINHRAQFVRQFYSYKKYPYVHCFDDSNHSIYMTDTDGFHFFPVGFIEVQDWCKKNCKGIVRFDFHIVSPDDNNQLTICHLGFLDSRYFVAFSDEKDYTWFMLRWS